MLHLVIENNKKKFHYNIFKCAVMWLGVVYVDIRVLLGRLSGFVFL